MAARTDLRAMLSGGDRRSLGRAGEVIRLVLRNPRKIAAVMDCLCDSDPIVRTRASDVVEKFSRERAPLLERFKPLLLSLLAEVTQQEVRWHLAVIVPRLRLTNSERALAVEHLHRYLDDRSSIVKVMAIQGLTDLTRQDPALLPGVVEMLHALSRSGTAAMRARGRILLRQLELPAR